MSMALNVARVLDPGAEGVDTDRVKQQHHSRDHRSADQSQERDMRDQIRTPRP